MKVVQNSYDLFNQWVAKNLDPDGPGGAAATDQFFIQNGGNIVLAFDGSAATDVSNRFLWSASGPVGLDPMILTDEKVTSTGSPGSNDWTLTDLFGSVTDIANYFSGGGGSTSVLGHAAYDWFGKQSSSGSFSLIGFAGKPFDPDTGLTPRSGSSYDAAVAVTLAADNPEQGLAPPPPDVRMAGGSADKSKSGTIKTENGSFVVRAVPDATLSVDNIAIRSGQEYIYFEYPASCHILQFAKSEGYDRNNKFVLSESPKEQSRTRIRSGEWHIDVPMLTQNELGMYLDTWQNISGIPVLDVPRVEGNSEPGRQLLDMPYGTLAGGVVRWEQSFLTYVVCNDKIKYQFMWYRTTQYDANGHEERIYSKIYGRHTDILDPRVNTPKIREGYDSKGKPVEVDNPFFKP